MTGISSGILQCLILLLNIIYSMIYNLRFMFIWILVAAMLHVSHQTCQLNPNTRALIDTQPTLIGKVQNGEKLMIGNLQDPEGNYLYIARLKGTSYEMGKAFGQLFAEQIHDQLTTFYNYYNSYLEEMVANMKYVPSFMKPFLIKKTPFALNQILDLDIAVTKKYTNKRYIEELRGMAEGAGLDPKIGERLNIFPEFIKAACTVAGLWGKATKNGETLHMRALDWDSANPINKYPLITVYHPTEKGVNKHANFAWVGFVGVLTGMSQKITVGEKVWLPPKNSVKMTRFGTPWTYVLRDLISEATNMTQAISLLTNAHRTCAIHLGVGSTDDHSFRTFEYSYKILNNYNDTNYTFTAAHPKGEGVAYFDKHVQPSNDDCVGSILIKSRIYGNWEAESFWRALGQSHQTGDTQLAVFDLQAQQVLISYSRNYKILDQIKTQKAFLRSPILIDMEKMWSDF